jgi:NAD(P)-dependent dehydrogenase (short-subunit alcohol dehydrogenase family)
MDFAEDSGRLRGRTALITGGARGIGRAIAERFQSEGARVLILDCDEQAGRSAAQQLTTCQPLRPAIFVKADLESSEDISAAAGLLSRNRERIDVLINNAGIEVSKSLAETTLADWDRVMAVNLRGAFLLSQAIVPLFPESGGAIVNIGSIHSTHAFPDSIAYACSKAGLLALNRNLALELAPRRIRVNAVCPGYIDTRLWEEYIRNTMDPKALAEQTAALHPLGRRGLPSDVAEAVLFFAVGGDSFITGTHLVVDGGLTIRAHP